MNIYKFINQFDYFLKIYEDDKKIIFVVLEYEILDDYQIELDEDEIHTMKVIQYDKRKKEIKEIETLYIYEDEIDEKIEEIIKKWR